MRGRYEVVEEVEGLYRVVPLKVLRRTPGVFFDLVPVGAIARIDAIDRLIHEKGALSPGSVGNVKQPWYMHTHQEDNLIVVHGARFIDIYTRNHGKMEHFVVTPSVIEHGDKVVLDGPGMITWPVGVFHRIRSAEDVGSVSLNFAAHFKGFDIRTNFNIYNLNVQAGDYRLIRAGYLDQPDATQGNSPSGGGKPRA